MGVVEKPNDVLIRLDYVTAGLIRLNQDGIAQTEAETEHELGSDNQRKEAEGDRRSDISR
jgi:hypothetical protein